MIHNIYILTRDGMCVLHRKYGSLEADEVLVSGFLSALTNFGKTISGKEIESINFGDKKFVSVSSDELLFVSYCDKEDEVRNTLMDIRDQFIKSYGSLQGWNGERGLFENFLVEIDKIVGLKGKEGEFNSDKIEEIMNSLKEGKLSAREATDKILEYYLKKVQWNKVK